MITQQKAKPFLKWAGGKNQLLDQIVNALPKDFTQEDYIYVEPFVGGGAVLFWLLQNFPNVKKAVINDINTDLINTYNAIRCDLKRLIELLGLYEEEYHSLLEDDEKKKEYYYQKRSLFNSRASEPTVQSALMIFLNRTCFNGLYRVNRKNEFNVPIGSYKKPTICDSKNLIRVNEILQNVTILNEDFETTIKYASSKTFFYFDPPYKPLSNTSSFNSYSKDGFNDEEQIRLSNFCRKLDKLGSKWTLSNSDVRTHNPKDLFFDRIYDSFNISRVLASRNINANPNKRGKLTELLISNYDHEKIMCTFEQK